MPSFSQQIKNELARHPLQKRCCALAELRAFLQARGKFIIGQETAELTIQVQSPSTARRLFSLLKFCFDLTPEILFYRSKGLQKSRTFLVRITRREDSFKVLKELGFLSVNPEKGESFFDPFRQRGLYTGALKEKCCRRAFLRGSFLAGGSINNPGASYHLEMVVPYESHAEFIRRIMTFFGLAGRYFQRKEDYVIYLKGAEEIGEFLRIISASSALLNFENFRILKGFRNKVNRLVNCETANLTKTVFASQEQISNIKFIERTLGLENLSPSLRQIALLRLSFPEATLKELGAMAIPPLSKSSVNHRLRRISALARKIKENPHQREKPICSPEEQ